MKRTYLYSIVLILVYLPCFAVEPIYIGLSAPITGKYAMYGIFFQKAIDIAIVEINETGGINGRLVKIITKDSEGVPKIAKRVARKFTKDKRILAVIGDFSSSCSMAAAPVYQRGKMVQLSPTSSHPSFAPGSPYSFGINAPQQVVGDNMAKNAVNRLNKKKLAILHVNSDWGLVAQKYFVVGAKKLGATITTVETYLEGTTNFIPILKKIQSLNPELLYLGVMVKDSVQICKQIQKIGWTITLMGAGPNNTPQLIEEGGRAVENLYVNTAFFPGDPSPKVQQFVKFYKKLYNEIPIHFSALAYDSMSLLALAIKKAGTDRQKIRDELAEINDFNGLTGNLFFTAEGQVKVKAHLLLQVKNGEFVLSETGETD